MKKEILDRPLNSLVEGILDSYEKYPLIRNIDSTNRINRAIVLEILENIRKIIFPGYFETRNLKQNSLSYHVGEILEDIDYNLTKQTARALQHREENPPASPEAALEEAASLVNQFLARIPAVREVLMTDVQAGYDGDPAAYNTDEIILSYPGLYAIFVNRLAHELFLLGGRRIIHIKTEYAHGLTGIDIHGVVVGETTKIGKNVKIYQGVTLGALSTRGGQSLRHTKRHPTLEDNVTVYSGASILGGETVIGQGAVIGSNAFITSSVPANMRVSIKNPELQFKDRSGKVGELGQEGFFNRKETD